MTAKHGAVQAVGRWRRPIECHMAPETGCFLCRRTGSPRVYRHYQYMLEQGEYLKQFVSVHGDAPDGLLVC